MALSLSGSHLCSDGHYRRYQFKDSGGDCIGIISRKAIMPSSPTPEAMTEYHYSGEIAYSFQSAMAKSKTAYRSVKNLQLPGSNLSITRPETPE